MHKLTKYAKSAPANSNDYYNLPLTFDVKRVGAVDPKLVRPKKLVPDEETSELLFS